MRLFPYEMQLLAGPLRLLEKLVREVDADPADTRLQFLEAASSCCGGFALPDYFDCAAIRPVIALARLHQAGRRILESIAATAVPAPLALSALAREPASTAQQRATGNYYTDFRLARHMAAQVAPILNPGSRVIDPSSGSGMLLTAIILAVCGDDRRKVAAWLANSIFAADIAPQALRGVRLALASMTEDLAAVQALARHLHCLDSLAAPPSAWQALTGDGFDLVIGNPPWKKIKLSRHEYLTARGETRHYGAALPDLDATGYPAEKARIGRYAHGLAEWYPLLGTGDPDLYKAFLELFFRLAKPGGRISVLLPAGLIRSQGTQALRRHLFDASKELHMEVIDNRARFFAIDSRFKFLLLSCVTRTTAAQPLPAPAIRLLHTLGTREGVRYCGEVQIEREGLRRMRPDLTIPEVRCAEEWRIFKTMSRNGTAWTENAGWRADIFREADMTRDRHHFLATPLPGALPLVEGRMVHQHRFGVKAYLSGSGRRARWEALPVGQSRIAPQFWIAPMALGAKARARCHTVRAGFCDITGQTNERSMLAALIPAGVACGNKVPTVCFPDDPSEDRLFLWLAIVNSLPFDWLLRRVLTTTINYFLLLSVPLPVIDKASPAGQRLIRTARHLAELDRTPASASTSGWRMAGLRGLIDVAVASAYGLGLTELEVMLRDFPLLDRGQPPLPGEACSTVTRDYLLLLAAQQYGIPAVPWEHRVATARQLGAVAYVPSLTATARRKT